MKIKNFIKEHKVEIAIGAVVGGAIIATVLTRKYLRIKIEQIEGKSGVIKGKTIDEVIDFILSASENDKFAVFKEGPLFEIVDL